jgi:hypothetical protein
MIWSQTHKHATVYSVLSVFANDSYVRDIRSIDSFPTSDSYFSSYSSSLFRGFPLFLLSYALRAVASCYDLSIGMSLLSLLVTRQVTPVVGSFI